jgi:DNA-binding MarR family transcriptional regulator
MPATSGCNCLALRQAGRHVTQFYDQCLAPCGLRATQYSVLAALGRLGPVAINALARELVMDRTTLGRTVLPLERAKLITIRDAALDRRSKELSLTAAGIARVNAASRSWAGAQARFERAFGPVRTAKLRSLLGAVVGTRLPADPGGAKPPRTARSVRPLRRRRSMGRK